MSKTTTAIESHSTDQELEAVLASVYSHLPPLDGRNVSLQEISVLAQQAVDRIRSYLGEYARFHHQPEQNKWILPLGSMLGSDFNRYRFVFTSSLVSDAERVVKTSSGTTITIGGFTYPVVAKTILLRKNVSNLLYKFIVIVLQLVYNFPSSHVPAIIHKDSGLANPFSPYDLEHLLTTAYNSIRRHMDLSKLNDSSYLSQIMTAIVHRNPEFGKWLNNNQNMLDETYNILLGLRRRQAVAAGLVEAARLPLMKDAMSSHDMLLEKTLPHLIAVMDPMDFLKLTTIDQRHLKEIMTESVISLESYKKRYEMPFLLIDWDTGIVLGHEGRHRASMLIKSTGDKSKFPVAIYLNDIKFMVQWKSKKPGSRALVERKHKIFDLFDDADKFVKVVPIKDTGFIKFEEWLSGPTVLGTSGLNYNVTLIREMKKDKPLSVEGFPLFLSNQEQNGFKLPKSKLHGLALAKTRSINHG